MNGKDLEGVLRQQKPDSEEVKKLLLGNKDAGDILLKVAESSSGKVQKRAAGLLEVTLPARTEKNYTRLVELLQSKEDHIARSASSALVGLKEKRAVPYIRKRAESANPIIAKGLLLNAKRLEQGLSRYEVPR